jgi:hypothetical protein
MIPSFEEIPMPADLTKRAHWQKIINQWKESGLSVTKFCQIHNHSVHQLFYFRSILDTPSKPKSKFSKIKVENEPPVEIPQLNRISIYIDGASIELEGHYSPAYISELFKGLKR